MLDWLFHIFLSNNHPYVTLSSLCLRTVWIEHIFAKIETENTSKIILKCVNSVVDLFLMKKLLKSEICGYVDSV